MKKVLRKLIPQKLINTFKHKPAALAANLRYGFPSRKLKVIGVTGTDGKTTTVNMIYQILKDAGKQVSVVSTINAVVAGTKYETGFHVTSPSSNMIQKFLRQAVKAGDEYAILEVTSHALDQHRFSGVKFDIAVVTNITHEHLDYHRTFNNYLKTKAKLVRKAKVVILNRDEKHFSTLSKVSKGKVISFGFDNKSDYNPKSFPLSLKIPGRFNILNGLAAAAASTALGIDSISVKKSLANFKNLEGRMEEVKNQNGLKIVIDFAHTPNGLHEALKFLHSEAKPGKLISIIGAEGQRDQGKRELMGEVAQKLSDFVIVTAVDPRGDLSVINEQIKKGCLKAKGKIDENLFFIDDRVEAIGFAINKLAKKGDTIGIFGKGHEKSMNLDGKNETSWSDREATQKVLDGR